MRSRCIRKWSRRSFFWLYYFIISVLRSFLPAMGLLPLRHELSISLSLFPSLFYPSLPLTLFSLLSVLYNIFFSFLSCIYLNVSIANLGKAFFNAHLSTHRLAYICARMRINSTGIFRKKIFMASSMKKNVAMNMMVVPTRHRLALILFN